MTAKGDKHFKFFKRNLFEPLSPFSIPSLPHDSLLSPFLNTSSSSQKKERFKTPIWKFVMNKRTLYSSEHFLRNGFIQKHKLGISAYHDNDNTPTQHWIPRFLSKESVLHASSLSQAAKCIRFLFFCTIRWCAACIMKDVDEIERPSESSAEAIRTLLGLSILQLPIQVVKFKSVKLSPSSSL